MIRVVFFVSLGLCISAQQKQCPPSMVGQRKQATVQSFPQSNPFESNKKNSLPQQGETEDSKEEENETKRLQPNPIAFSVVAFKGIKSWTFSNSSTAIDPHLQETDLPPEILLFS